MKLLIFTRTTDYRHASIAEGVVALRGLAEAAGLDAHVSQDAGCFTPESLASFRAVVWLSTSGDVLDPTQRTAFERFIRAGGSYVGVHSASATLLDWPFYGELVGARFVGHPPLQLGRLVVEDREHPATAHLGTEWNREDEWYAFDQNPRPHVRVLISVDESSYAGGRMGDHPLVWCRELGSARSFYSALGHSPGDYQDPDFLLHLAGGLAWATGAPLASPALRL